DMGPGLGPGTPRPNEDTEFGRRLMAAGEHLRYEPNAVLYHPVALDRINQKFFLAWWFDYGRAITRESNAATVWGINDDYFRIVKRLGLLPLEGLKWILSSDARKRFRHKYRMWCSAGQVAEVYRRLAYPGRKNVAPAKDQPEHRIGNGARHSSKF